MKVRISHDMHVDSCIHRPMYEVNNALIILMVRKCSHWTRLLVFLPLDFAFFANFLQHFFLSSTNFSNFDTTHKKNAVNAFFFHFQFVESIKYVVICLFPTEFHIDHLNEMMRTTGKIKLSTVEKKKEFSTQDTQQTIQFFFYIFLFIHMMSPDDVIFHGAWTRR